MKKQLGLGVPSPFHLEPVLLCIASYLRGEDLVAFSCVCKHFAAIISSNLGWKMKFFLDWTFFSFPSSPRNKNLLESKFKVVKNWRDQYFNFQKQFVETFNKRSPAAAIAFLIENGLIEHSFKAITLILFKKRHLLHSEKFANYLLSTKRPQMLPILMSLFDFRKLDFVDALRSMFLVFRLPGELPILDKFIECFVNHWMDQNQDQNCFTSADNAYAVVISIIMRASPITPTTTSIQEFVNQMSGLATVDFAVHLYTRLTETDFILATPCFRKRQRRGWLGFVQKKMFSTKLEEVWCTLRDGKLKLYKSQERTYPFQTIKIMRNSCKQCFYKDKIAFMISDGKKNHVFCSNNADVIREWQYSLSIWSYNVQNVLDQADRKACEAY